MKHVTRFGWLWMTLGLLVQGGCCGPEHESPSDDSGNSEDEDSSETVTYGGECSTGPASGVTDWRFRWGGEELADPGADLDNYTDEDSQTVVLSFTGELQEFGPDPTGEGLYLKVVEATNEQNPPPVESDIFELWYSLPHGLTLPVTLDERIQAEVAIDASGSATRVGLWLFSAAPQDRQVIFGSEIHPAGAGLPLGEDHPFLASATASQETVCEEAAVMQCSGARSTTVEFVPREGLELEDADSAPWRMWPGAEVTITDPLEPKPLTPWYVVGLSSAWAFDEDSDCPDAALGTSFSWWVVNEGYETFE